MRIPPPGCRPQPPDAVVMAQETADIQDVVRICAKHTRSRDRLRHRHLAGGPGQCARRRRLHRSARHEQGAGSPRRRSRLRDPARRHPQGAERASARPGRVLPDRSRRRRLARRHGLDPRLRHQRGALRHHARQRAGAESRARRRRDHHDRHAGEEILRRLRPDASVRRRRRHARHHLRTHHQTARHSRDHRGGGLFVRDRARRLPGDDPGDPDRHSRGAHRTAQRRAGARLQFLFETDAAGDAAAAAGIPRQRQRGRRAVEEFQARSPANAAAAISPGPPSRRIAPSSGRRGTTPIGR